MLVRPNSTVGSTQNPFILLAVRDYRKSYVSEFLDTLMKSNWDLIYTQNNINDMIALFNMYFNTAMECFPCKMVKRSSLDKPWMTNVLKSLINDRWLAYKNKQFAKYRALKIKIKTLITKAKQSWSNNIISKNHNPWHVVNKTINSSKRTNNISQFIKQFANTTFAVNEINNKFSSFFGSPSNYKFHGLNPPLCYNIEIEDYVVFKIINNIKTSYSSINSDIPSFLLKSASHIFCSHLSFIFQFSLENGVFPDAWKNSIILPFPKSR